MHTLSTPSEVTHGPIRADTAPVRSHRPVGSASPRQPVKLERPSSWPDSGEAVARQQVILGRDDLLAASPLIPSSTI